MPDTQHIDSKSLSEKQRVAFYGAMFAMAAADGQMQREELELIYETLDTEGLSEEARRRVRVCSTWSHAQLSGGGRKRLPALQSGAGRPNPGAADARHRRRAAHCDG